MSTIADGLKIMNVLNGHRPRQMGSSGTHPSAARWRGVLCLRSPAGQQSGRAAERHSGSPLSQGACSGAWASGERGHARLAGGCCADGRRSRARRITTESCASGARYVRDKTRPVVVTVAASDPILLAVAPDELALASGDRAARRTSTSVAPDELALASGDRAARRTSTSVAPDELALASGDRATRRTSTVRATPFDCDRSRRRYFRLSWLMMSFARSRSGSFLAACLRNSSKLSIAWLFLRTAA
jgi:hypothetical protein